MSLYCDVIVDIMHSATDRLFSYKISDGMELKAGQRVLVPFGAQKKEGYVLRTYDEYRGKLDEKSLKSVISPLDSYPLLTPELIWLSIELAKSTHCPLAMCIRLVLPANVRNGSVRIKKERFARLRGDIDFEEALKASSRSKRKRLILELLLSSGELAVSEISKLVRTALSPLRELESAGYIELFEREIIRTPYKDSEGQDEDFYLTANQTEVLDEIIPAIREGNGRFLLHGITGSGKTEVYIRAARQALKMGLGVIVLVPEIILTPQMVAWFRSRFGDSAAVLHSRLSAGEQFDQWRRIRFGDAKLVIGARSAIFAPVENLGLIIVDEEHEQSYFSDRNPQYDAREVALLRAKHERASVIFASATPSIDSFSKVSSGEMMILEMPERANGRPLPKVEIVDMREELRLGNRSIFSHALRRAMDKALERGEQVLLFVNRRGYASSVVCRNCGEAISCKNCDVSMTYHENDKSLHCHYCGGIEPLPKCCPKCQSPYLKTVGIGTERVEQEVKKLYPKHRTLRIDIDTTREKDSHQRLVESFRRGEADILIGTQMVAKGLDFPNLSVVGAILADISVNFPDYRAPERTFQLLTQVAGRAGRANTEGRVIIQSYKPEHYAISMSASQDYRSFFKKEIERRKKGLYPPYTRFLRLLIENTDKDSLEREAERSVEMISELLIKRPDFKKFMIFYRLDDAPIKCIMKRFRKQVLIKLINKAGVEELLDGLSSIANAAWESSFSLELNPNSFA